MPVLVDFIRSSLRQLHSTYNDAIGDLSEEQVERLSQISERCPVHRTLQGGPRMFTEVDHAKPQYYYRRSSSMAGISPWTPGRGAPREGRDAAGPAGRLAPRGTGCAAGRPRGDPGHGRGDPEEAPGPGVHQLTA